MMISIPVTICIVWDFDYWASASRGVFVYVAAFASTHFAYSFGLYPLRDGQAVFAWIAVYIPRWSLILQVIIVPGVD